MNLSSTKLHTASFLTNAVPLHGSTQKWTRALGCFAQKHCYASHLLCPSSIRPLAPAPLEGLEGLLQGAEHQLGLQLRGLHWEHGRLAVRRGEAAHVDLRVRPLELSRNEGLRLEGVMENASAHLLVPTFYIPDSVSTAPSKASEGVQEGPLSHD